MNSMFSFAVEAPLLIFNVPAFYKKSVPANKQSNKFGWRKYDDIRQQWNADVNTTKAGIERSLELPKC